MSLFLCVIVTYFLIYVSRQHYNCIQVSKNCTGYWKEVKCLKFCWYHLPLIPSSIDSLFHWYHIPLIPSSIDAIVYRSCILLMSSDIMVTFLWAYFFIKVIIYIDRIPWRCSSILVIFHWGCLLRVTSI